MQISINTNTRGQYTSHTSILALCVCSRKGEYNVGQLALVKLNAKSGIPKRTQLCFSETFSELNHISISVSYIRARKVSLIFYSPTLYSSFRSLSWPIRVSMCFSRDYERVYCMCARSIYDAHLINGTKLVSILNCHFTAAPAISNTHIGWCSP